MRLKTYLKNKGYGFGVIFAKKLKITPVYLSTIANKHRPSPDLALRIQEATNGEVTVMELLFPTTEPLSKEHK